MERVQFRAPELSRENPSYSLDRSAQVAVSSGHEHAALGLTLSPTRRRGITVLEDMPCPMCAIMAPHELAARASVTLDECSAYPLMYQDSLGLDAALLR